MGTISSFRGFNMIFDSNLAKRNRYDFWGENKLVVGDWVYYIPKDSPYSIKKSKIKEMHTEKINFRNLAPRCSIEDYRETVDVGLSKGHMCPAGDCKWDSGAMAETNLLTNICPQEQGLNSGMWNQIEQACRRWATKYGCIYIICGPLLFRQKHQTIGAHNVVVPEAFFKVVLRLGDNPAYIGYGKKKSYVNSLSQLERITGYHFFPNLADSIRNQIKDIADEDMW